jgi:hypothetical protein
MRLLPRLDMRQRVVERPEPPVVGDGRLQSRLISVSASVIIANRRLKSMPKAVNSSAR